MTPRLRLARDLVVLLVVVVASLSWLRGQDPARQLEPAVGEPDLPARSTCEGVPADRGELRIDSTIAVECPDQLDGRGVLYVGEVVGDVLDRADGSWVQVNDDPYALTFGPLPVAGEQAGTNSGLAVWLPDPLDDDVLPGRARQRGTVLAVTGAFHRADPRDGGGTTIRADAIEVLHPGEPLQVDLELAPVAVAVALLAAAAVQWQWGRRGPMSRSER